MAEPPPESPAGIADSEPVGGQTPVASLAANRQRLLAVRGGTAVELPDLDQLADLLKGDDCRAWLDLTDPDPDVLARLTDVLGLHPLVIENIGESNQRPKVEQLGDILHAVLFAIHFEGEARSTEIDFVLGERYLVTVHERDWDPYMAPMLKSGQAALLERGPDYLLYALSDWIVDGYFPVLDHLADEIDQLQDDVVEKASQWTLHRLFVLKRELIGLRRATSPAREVFNQLTNRELTLIRPDHVVYFRDVYDHLIRVTDELDNYRELVSGTLDVYLSTVNNNLSLIMKRLTGVTVILAGIGAVAGVFGMSEAGTAFAGKEASGFWMVTAATVALGAIVVVVLRRIDWI